MPRITLDWLTSLRARLAASAYARELLRHGADEPIPYVLAD